MISSFMGLSYNGMKKLLESNVAELYFVRRNKKQNWPMTRRMLCTNSFKLLGSMGGRMALNFKVPTQLPAYDPKDENLFITWDFFMQDFRSIPLESVGVIMAIPVKTTKEIESFWEWFDKFLRPLSSDNKKSIMKK
jgi:hypothetical protein